MSMKYHKYLKGPLLIYVITGLFFALTLGGYVFISQSLKGLERIYHTLLKAKGNKALVVREIQRMKQEISLIQGRLTPQKPEIALYNEIDRYERLGFKVSPGSINRKGSIVSMNLTLRIQTEDLRQAGRRLRELISERFPLLLIDSVSISPNSQKTAIQLTIRARTVAVSMAQKT